MLPPGGGVNNSITRLPEDDIRFRSALWWGGRALQTSSGQIADAEARSVWGAYLGLLLRWWDTVDEGALLETTPPLIKVANGMMVMGQVMSTVDGLLYLSGEAHLFLLLDDDAAFREYMIDVYSRWSEDDVSEGYRIYAW